MAEVTPQLEQPKQPTQPATPETSSDQRASQAVPGGSEERQDYHEHVYPEGMEPPPSTEGIKKPTPERATPLPPEFQAALVESSLEAAARVLYPGLNVDEKGVNTGEMHFENTRTEAEMGRPFANERILEQRVTLEKLLGIGPEATQAERQGRVVDFLAVTSVVLKNALNPSVVQPSAEGSPPPSAPTSPAGQ